MTVVNRLFPSLAGGVVLLLSGLVLDGYVAKSRAASLCEQFNPRTDLRRANELTVTVLQAPGLVQFTDQRGRRAITNDTEAFSAWFSGPFSSRMQCVVWFESGKVKDTRVTDKHVPLGATRTIGIR